MLRGMRDMAYEEDRGARLDSLKFTKLGSDIQRSIDGRVTALDVQCSGWNEKIAAICKDRQIDAAEVLAAESEEQVTAYSNKVMANAPRSNAALTALQDDLNMLRALTNSIAFEKGRQASLVRVKKNIAPEASFDLTLAELVFLGF